MTNVRSPGRLAQALLATTMLTVPGPVHAAPGDAVGPEFPVNSFTNDNQSRPAVAMDAGGGFVVAWRSNGQDGSGFGVFAQRFDAAGVAQGDELWVNTFTTDTQGPPAVAIDSDGDFVVVWRSFGNQDGDDSGIFAQRYDGTGEVQGGEFPVNAFTTGAQGAPDVAMDADGDFVVAWADYDARDGSAAGVFAQRYDAAGTPQAPEFQVNTFTAGSQFYPSVGMDADGDFVVVWTNATAQDGSDNGVFAQRYDAAGTARDPEFQVNSHTTGDQRDPAVAMDADGDFVVVWTDYSGQDGDSWGIFAQRFDAAGAPQGDEFRVNTFTTGAQRYPAVAMDADGDFVVAWTDQCRP